MNITREIGRNPRIDWIIVLILSFILAISVALGSIYLYKAVTKDNINSIPISKVEIDKIFNSKALSQVLNNSYEKGEIWKKVKNGYTGLADPSI